LAVSRERLLRLYKEIRRKSPPKGMLPFSTDWFMAWQPNIHSSLFLNIYEFLNKASELDQIDALIKAYQLYLEHTSTGGLDPVLTVTRAWRLVKFVDSGMLRTTPCRTCNGKFVIHTNELYERYRCGLCHMPARAGKTAKAADAARAEASPLLGSLKAATVKPAAVKPATPRAAVRRSAPSIAAISPG
jgi:flagellar transcriptional activator FlhC